MQVFVFHSKKGDRRLGFTRDHTGANLPAELGPWHPTGTETISWRERSWREKIGSIGNQNIVAATINANGYCVAEAGKLIITHKPPPSKR